MKIFSFFTNRIILSVLLIVFAVGIWLAAWAFWYEPSGLWVKKHELKISGWNSALNGYKIVAVSDVHGGSFYVDEAKLRRIVELINQQDADMVVLLGDFVTQIDHRDMTKISMPMAQIADGLRGIKAKNGVYAVIGNHDWWYNDKSVEKELEQVGIKVLENEIEPLEANGQKFWLLGIEDYWRPTKPKIEEPLKRVSAGEPVLAITHNPDVFVRLKYTPISLLLAGHTHGGQCNFPIIGAPIVPSEYKQRFLSGHIIEEGKHLFVTVGIGGVPIRFFAPPEIAVLTVTAN